jgi:hypothetical protein
MSIAKDLQDNLNAADKQTRLETVRVIAMVEETRALAALGARFKQESDAEVQEAINWAGGLVAVARRNGYSTIDEIFRYFGVMRTVKKRSTQELADLEKLMQDKLDVELIKMKRDALGGRAASAAIAAGFGAALGSTSLAAQGIQSSMGDPSGNLGAAREALSTERTPAPRPSDANIAVWVKRLTGGQSVADRIKAARELVTLNNITALQPMANQFASEASEQGRTGIQEQGKLLYWGAVYFEMEQDGTLERLMEERARAAGIEYKK